MGFLAILAWINNRQAGRARNRVEYGEKWCGVRRWWRKGGRHGEWTLLQKCAKMAIHVSRAFMLPTYASASKYVNDNGAAVQVLSVHHSFHKWLSDLCGRLLIATHYIGVCHIYTDSHSLYWCVTHFWWVVCAPFIFKWINLIDIV